MFCYQCEQTAGGTGCDTTGACGKRPDIAALQDLLFEVTKAVARSGAAADAFLEDALFTTVTNVNFDAGRIVALIRQGAEMLAEAGAASPVAVTATPEEMVAAGHLVSLDGRIAALGPDVAGLQELLAYGVKGVAAYARHARVLGRTSPAVDGFVREALTFLAGPVPDAGGLLAMALRCGEAGLQVMELLDGANTDRFGQPEPAPVTIGWREGKAILVSGHDLADLADLLEATAGMGINVYTHGEMLPAHGYPELRKYPHLVGHYGGAWQDQLKDFAAFPGAILLTTNCLMPPRASYSDRLFTTGVVGFPGIPHLPAGAFGPLIAAALEAPGFTDARETGRHMVGFGHHAVLGVADTVIGAVKSGALKKFVLIGGCDAATTGRGYYSDLAEALPADWAVLTLGCGKYRVLGRVEGTIGPLPRLLDMGQCNDAFSAIKVAGALAQAFGVGVNELPLHLVLSWFEQKAVTVLLALLHLGVKNIRIGPRLPAFVSPAMLQVLVEQFNVMPIGDVQSDLRAMAA
ncbi:Hydroxylamine reductase [Rhodovastum atsumiense]|uniref:Hydroxylamine reductase n=1 Tax=Rhodovastum atsumiense TaxID=504468 RepID=A0A5M6INH4_9PROT|nr:hydroxylamine reductase [Rhodovastum atsumiense]KAA5609015.1 hydroxylamine reductase [Rhodovastum atsumiense]CAH2599067.1 Hydroxylamine reductase [Rhodovastum atsumiense]